MMDFDDWLNQVDVALFWGGFSLGDFPNEDYRGLFDRGISPTALADSLLDKAVMYSADDYGEDAYDH